MKKILFSLFALMVIGANVVNAQTKEEMQTMQDRNEKLSDLCVKEPKSTGDADLDIYVIGLFNSAVLSMSTSEILEGLYYRSLGQTKDGVTDVTVKKPTVEELTALSVTIATQAINLKAVVEQGQNVIKAAKKQKNPMKAAKIAKGVAFSVAVSPLLVEESIAQVKAIAEMIKTASTAKNL